MTEKLEVGAYEAKTHLPDLLRRVRAGQRFTITQRGEPVADLVPAGADLAQAGSDAAQRMRAFMLAARDATPPGSEVVDIKALMTEGRD
jgi:prevent-host-death family protein